jgi:hypothetical protein
MTTEDSDGFRLVQLTPPGSGCSVQFGANITNAPPGSAQGLVLTVPDIKAARLDHASYSSFVSFSDPDGNGWLRQEVTARLPGRVDPAHTSFSSASDLAAAMTRASIAHGEHEKRIGHADADRPDWYAKYMVAEQAGTELPV